MNVNEIAADISLTSRQFSIEIAETPQQLREVYRLRHQVYCVERGFEAGKHGEETDEFDSRSRHVLLRHSNDGQTVGTVRIIASRATHLDASFPMQRLCEKSFLRGLPLHTTGEISRFAISKERRLSCTSAVLLRLALLRGIVHLSHEMELTHWLAVMERSLVRLHQRNGIHFDPLGPLVSYHGIRQPTSGSIPKVLDRIRREQAQVWDFLTDGGAWFGHVEQFAKAA